MLNKVVIAISSPINATLSSLSNLNDTLSKTLTPSTVLVNPSTSKTSFPISLSGVNPTYGYLLLDGCISSTSNFSNCFFLEVACFALEAFELNLAMNSFN